MLSLLFGDVKLGGFSPPEIQLKQTALVMCTKKKCLPVNKNTNRPKGIS